MDANDLKVVRAIPGNDKCCDCGMKHPQWASVSFGNVFCLECSGVHRYVRCVVLCSRLHFQISCNVWFCH